MTYSNTKAAQAGEMKRKWAEDTLSRQKCVNLLYIKQIFSS